MKISRSHFLKLALAFTIILNFNAINAQQDPYYTQYLYNTQVINPAYAGTWESTGFMLLGRRQWTGLNMAPNTYTLALQVQGTPKVGLGLNLVSDQIGFEKRVMVSADYSYRLQVGEDLYLRMGLKAGLNHYSVNFGDYIGYPGANPDPVFAADPDNQLKPNFGVGLFLYGKRKYLGISMPRILKNNLASSYNNYSDDAEERYLFINGGYAMKLSEGFDFMPAAMLMASINSPIELMVSGSFIVRQKISMGVFYRTFDTFGFMGQWIIDPRFRLGYSYDFNTSELQHYHHGTHQVMISYEFGKTREEGIVRLF